MAYDVFVSYAHRDNQAAEGEPFVSRLLKFIGTEGGKKYGRQIAVFYDGVLESGTQWKEAIYDELNSCRVFLPIVSPSWATSTWTGGEWDAVSNRVRQDQDLGRQTRIVPVAYLLDKGSEASLPDRVRSLQVNHFFRGIMSNDDFRMEADLLTAEIVDRLKLLDKIVCEQNVPDKNANDVQDLASCRNPNKAKAFLGFAFSDATKSSRNRLRGELDDRGYGIREVELNLSWTAQQLINEIEKQVDGCAMAVHFLEESAGPTFTGDGRPILQIQCDVGRLRLEERFNLFWTGQVPDEKLKKYPEFVQTLKYTNEPIVTFASSLLDSLKTQERRMSTNPQARLSSVPIIWVICERGDLEIAPDIVRFFADRGWVAFVPGFNAREIPYSDIFKKENYFLFYWGKGEKEWCQINYEALVNARRVENGFRPPRAALVYNGKAKRDYKENFEWLFLKAPEYDRFNPQAPKVQEFMNLVELTFKSSSFAASAP